MDFYLYLCTNNSNIIDEQRYEYLANHSDSIWYYNDYYIPIRDICVL